ncbi:MAG: hypothetical protein CJBNEKGG_04405 [Prosthecobacter sp.]|nr:hypothetical protein [Prosthecobacter sp.]
MAESMSWMRSLREWLRLLPFIGRPCLIVRRYGGLGDLLSLMPGLEALKQKHPAHALILVTSPGLVKIAALAGVAALVLPSTLRGSGWLATVLKPALDITPQLADELEPPGQRRRRLLMEEFAGLLRVELKAPLQPVRIQPQAQGQEAVRARLADAGVPLEKLVVIHSGPSWPVKHWPEAHWCRLVEALKARGHAVIQTGAKGHDGNAEVQMPAVEGAIDWRDRLELPELAALLSLARLFVGIDSGPLHLAASVGVPMIGLFGPTDASSILPPMPEATAVHADIACLGCHHQAGGPLHWRSGCPHEVACMKLIDPDMVIRACELRLNREAGPA